MVWLSAIAINSLPWVSCVTTRRFCPFCHSTVPLQTSSELLTTFPIMLLEFFITFSFFSANRILILSMNFSKRVVLFFPVHTHAVSTQSLSTNFETFPHTSISKSIFFQQFALFNPKLFFYFSDLIIFMCIIQVIVYRLL